MSTAVDEVKSLIVKQGEDWQNFQHKSDTRIKSIEDHLLAMTSPGVGGSNFGGSTGHEDSKAFMSFVRTGRDEEVKAMSAGSDPDGGYMMPTQMDNTISKYLRSMSAMRRLARVVPVGAAEFQQVHSRGGTTCGWVGETQDRPKTTTPNLSLITVPTREMYALPAITQKLLDDAAFDVESWLIEELAEVFGDEEADTFINGNGIAKPRGLFTYDVASTADATREHTAFQYIPTGASGGLNSSDPVDAFISLVYSVKPRYRQNASWLLSPEVLEAIRKLKNPTTGEYIFQPAMHAGQPATLLGYPIEEDEYVPAIGAGSLSAAFGDFSRAYTITDRSTSLLRDPYTEKPYVLFYSTKRVGGGGGRDTRAVKFLKFASS